MAFRVFLDTCVLHPAHLRDTLWLKTRDLARSPLEHYYPAART